jgi:hypothetical protein
MCHSECAFEVSQAEFVLSAKDNKGRIRFFNLRSCTHLNSSGWRLWPHPTDPSAWLEELHENNEEINQTFNNINNNSQNMGNETQYKVKKNTDKKNTKNKTNIIREHFGLS